MKRISLLYILAISVAGSVLLLSCDKDNDPPPLPDQVKKLMFDWKITAITTPKKNEPETDSSLLKTCMTDDIIRFNSAGFDFQDGATKCDSSVFYYSKGNWGYKSVGDSIQLGATTPAKYLSWKIIVLNDSVLRVKYIDSTILANKITKTISFKH